MKNQEKNIYYSEIYRPISRRFNLNSRFSNPFRNISSREIKKYLPIGLVILATLGIGYFLTTSLISSSNNNSTNDKKIEVKEAKASVGVDREFSFPLKDDKGNEVSRFKYTIQNAELRDEIIVKGQRATSVKGRTFLILNVKLVNDFNQSLQINTKDYVRLSTNGNEQELLAADIHNDPVEVQAISTKYTRLGFPINEGEKSIKIHVGEIKGEKQVVDINF